MTMAGMLKLVDEDFSAFDVGHLFADFTAQGEYYCLPRPAYPNGWYDPINHTGGRAGRLRRDQSSWCIQKIGGRQMLAQTIGAKAKHEAYMLVMGEKQVGPATIEAELKPGTPRECGVVFNYQHSRQFAAAILHGTRLELVVFEQSVQKIVASEKVSASKSYRRLTVTTSDASVRVVLNGKTLIKTGLVRAALGKVGLMANGACTFRRFAVRAGGFKPTPLSARPRRSSRYAPAELRCRVDLGDASAGRQVRFADLNGDGREEMVFAHPIPVMGRQWQYYTIGCLTAVDLDGNVLWRRGKPVSKPEPVTRDVPFQAADIDNRGRADVVAAFGDELHVIDGRTGKTRRMIKTPKPPKMEPYWNELSQFWGDGPGDDLPRLLPDSIRLCNLTGRRPFGDILLKDRYHCIYALDNRLKLRWIHRCVTGHYLYTADLDRDGHDEIVAGYSRLDWKGNLTGRLALSDHPDACFAMKLPGGVVRRYHPAGEEGLIIEDSRGYVIERKLGHVQHLSIGNFLPDRDGLELLTVLYWGNPGIIYLCDLDGRELRTLEGVGLGSVCQPVNWTADGQDLILLTPALHCGGLYDGEFNRVVPLPRRDRPSLCAEARDVLGEGVDQILVWDKKQMFIYGPSRIPREAKRYRSIRPRANQSNYMVYYSLPPGAGPAAE